MQASSWPWCAQGVWSLVVVVAIAIAFAAVWPSNDTNESVSSNDSNMVLCYYPPIVSFAVEDKTLGISKVINGSDTMKNASERSEAVMNSSTIVDHQEFTAEVRSAMKSTGFTLVMGPKHVGKTKVLKSMCAQDEQSCLYIDGRGNANLAMAVLDGLRNPAIEERAIMDRSIFQNSVLGQRVVETSYSEERPSWFFGRDETLDGHSNTVLDGIISWVIRIPDMLSFSGGYSGGKSSSKSTYTPINLPDVVPETIRIIERAAQTFGRFTLILDEARLILGKPELNEQDLTSLVMLSKQNSRVNVIMASSEGAFPYDLENFEGLQEQDLTTIVYAPALEVEPMKQELKSWGLAEEQAEQLTMYLGGHIFAIRAAVQWAADKRSVDISKIRAVSSERIRTESPVKRLKERSDVHDRQAQWQLMTKLAESGWAPIKNHRADEVQDLVRNHIAFLVTAPFPEHILPRGVNPAEATGHSMMLIPTSRMLQIALRDCLCDESWQKYS
eukprot:1071138-Amphidinium_carterae.1